MCLMIGILALSAPAAAQDDEGVAAVSESVDGQPLDGDIIEDEEFDATIPPLDDDIDAPMRSIEEWEDEADRAEAQGNEPEASDPPIAAADDGDPPPELLSDPPINDPEIDDPLPPIDGFEVEPVDDSLGEEDQEETVIRYDYRLEGLDEARKEVESVDIKDRFKGLSALESGDGEAANGAMINARLREDQQLLLDILSGQGYFDATVNGTIEPPVEEDGDLLTAVITAVPGPRYGFGSIAFDVAPLVPADLASSNFVPATGEPIVAERVLAAEANLGVVLPKNGYPFAKVGQRDILLDVATETGDYTLPIAAGPRSSFGDIVTEGDLAFDAEHVAVLARFDKGELYDSDMVDDLREALVATSLFNQVSVEPVQSGEPGPDGTEYATLLVRQDAGPPRTIAGNAGYGTGQGFRAEASWTHRNLFPPEGALILNAIGGNRQQAVGATFRRSNWQKRDRQLELAISADHSDFDAYEAYTGRIAGRISRVSTPIWQKTYTYSFGFELLGTNEQDYDFVKGALDRQTYWVGALPIQLGFDQSDDLLDPTEGYRLNLKLSPEASLGSGTQFYGRAIIEGSAYYPVQDNLVLAGRARVGTITGADRADIAPSRRFYGGGGGSVRGFGYQELGPKDPDDDPIGGRSLVEGAVEARYRFGNYGVVGFVDAGQVYTETMPTFDDIRFGVGVGGRFYTNFGPLRVDVATPIDKQPGESRVSIYISIGQAF